ncbi:TlpA family protein disulfide reductase [Kaistella sp. G5-32]|uniref:TlpA family protein disulfide reductase n=1 Tax=Kaistella gelatinilytica TaxID=2787636 RepID=A0ABS0FC45_9FLAO|nr:TlpA disulfide reductase family protein [Kaistella gelatinilytica]MBF8457300.1 TlpA family protein disulfide reductase [Kaistella gelatinilytica]
MNFLKKNIFNMIVIAFIAVLFIFPEVKLKLKDLFFPVAAIENTITLQDSDMDIQLKGINTPDINLKTLRGNKLIFLNFWGTWCPPCREEWPTIQKLYDVKKDKIDFVLIAMQDEEDKVRKFMKDNKYTVPVYIAQSPISSNVLPKVFPTTFLLYKNGRILLKEDASKDWNSKSVHEFIDNFTK